MIDPHIQRAMLADFSQQADALARDCLAIPDAERSEWILRRLDDAVMPYVRSFNVSPSLGVFWLGAAFGAALNRLERAIVTTEEIEIDLTKHG